MRVLALMPDSYGGPGGIAQYSRDLVDALAGAEFVESIVAVTRHAPAMDVRPPEKYAERPLPGSRARFAAESLRLALRARPDVVYCGHANMLGLGAAVSRAAGARLLLQVHGVEVWRPAPRRRAALHAADRILSVSRYTRERLVAWSGVDPHRVKVVPNTIRLERFRPGPRPAHLAERYGAGGRRVLLTLGRLSSRERYKGHDRVISALPELAARVPDVLYIVAGDGDDRPRLEALARGLGVERLVRFAGPVPEAEKVDHYNLADAFVMPSTGEGFGIVFLEAAACGLPVLGGGADGSRDALVDGELGVVVDPSSPGELLAGLERVLGEEKSVPAALERFAFPRFRAQVERVFASVDKGGAR